MTALPVGWFGTTLRDIENGSLDLTAVTLTATLHGSSFAPSSAFTATSQLSDEISGTGYTPTNLAGVAVQIVRQPDRATIYVSADATVWAALDPAARWIVVATGTRLLWWGDPGQVLNANGGSATARWQLVAEVWLPATPSEALGFFADTSSSAWTTATGFVGRVPRWRRQWARAASQVVGDGSWSPTLSGLRAIVDTAGFPGNLVAADVSHMLPLPALRGGQVLGANAAGDNDALWEGVADLVVEFGLDVPHADGRPKALFCPGWEANSSNVNYLWKYASAATDLTLPDRFAADIDHGIAQFKARVSALGGDPDGVEWAYGVLIRPGASNYGYEDHIIRGCPSLVDALEVDCYDSHFQYTSGMSQAERITAFNAATGVWYRKVNDRQGLDVCKDLATSRGIHMGFGEWAVHHKIAGSSNEGGEDNPDFVTEMHTYMASLAAADMLGPAAYFQSDANSNEQHKLTNGLFDDARDEFLSLFA